MSTYIDQQEAALAERVGRNAAAAMRAACIKQYGEDTETFYTRWQDVLDAHGIKPGKPAATPHSGTSGATAPPATKGAAPPAQRKSNPKPAAAQEGARTHVDGGYARVSNDVIEYLMAAM